MWVKKPVYVVTVEYDEEHGFHDGCMESFIVETLAEAHDLKKEYDEEPIVVDVFIEHEERTIWVA